MKLKPPPDVCIRQAVAALYIDTRVRLALAREQRGFDTKFTSRFELPCYRGLERVGTVDAVDYVAYANLANLNTRCVAGSWT